MRKPAIGHRETRFARFRGFPLYTYALALMRDPTKAKYAMKT